MFTEQELLELRTYNQQITYTPRLFYKQPWEKKDEHKFCEDWELIEILKYLFNGYSNYVIDPPPNRLKNNPLWKGKEDIKEKAEKLIREEKTASAIIKELKRIRSLEVEWMQ